MEYKLDDSLLLNSYLKKRWCGKNSEELSIELIIRPECNQKCDYCYITQYGDELYPHEYRVNNQTILNNLQMFLDYCLENEIYCAHWELFAGDLFYDNLWFNIMDIFKPYFLNLQKKVDYKAYKVLLPCNCSFFHDIEKTNKVSQYINDFEKIGVRISFSWSHDGPDLKQVREKRELNDEFYKTAFEFLEKHHYGSHPMISVEGIDEVKNQYNWWKEKWAERRKKNPQFKEYLPMFLEVRNNNWSKESIDKYLTFLDYVVEDRLVLCDNNPEKLAYHLFYTRPRNNKIKSEYASHLIPLEAPNDFIRLHYGDQEKNKKNCTLGNSYSINLSKLTLVPCHRMTYEFFEAGQFITNSICATNKKNELTNNNYINSKILNPKQKIIGLEAKQGLSAYLNVQSANPRFAPKCCVCEFRDLCMKGCYGSQFETYGDWSMPIPEVCELLKAKYDFLIKKYYSLGVFDVIFQNPKFPMKDKAKHFYANYINKLKKEGKV